MLHNTPSVCPGYHDPVRADVYVDASPARQHSKTVAVHALCFRRALLTSRRRTRDCTCIFTVERKYERRCLMRIAWFESLQRIVACVVPSSMLVSS